MAEFLNAVKNVRDVIHPEVVAKHGEVLTKHGEVQSSKDAIDIIKVAIDTKHSEVVTKSDEIKSLSVISQGLLASEAATASYDSATGTLTFGIPNGEKGESFNVDATGLLADKSTYDDNAAGFSFLATDTAQIFFKLSAATADWSAGSSFGKGDKGDTGVTGAKGDKGDAGATTGDGVTLDTTSFNNNLSSADNTIQKALETLDNLSSLPTSITPTLTGNTSATETTTLDVTIGNYSATATYTISLEAGTFLRVGNTITLTLPAYTGVDDSHILSVQATEPASLISLSATHTVSVIELVGGVSDQTVLFENTTMSATEFPATTNVYLTSNTLLTTADTASATSSVISQDGGDGDFTNATPTMDNVAKNFTIDSATNTSATVSGQVLADGDTVLLNDGVSTSLVEFDTTTHFTDNGDSTYTLDLTTASLTNAPTTIAKDTSSIATSIVATGASDSFQARAIVSHTANADGKSVLNNEFETVLWTGNGGVQNIPLSNITGGVDFVWGKDRDSSEYHSIVDSIRGSSATLFSNATNGEVTIDPRIGGLNESSIDIASSTGLNTSGNNIVGWCASLPNHTLLNTNGTITSETRSNSFMSVISYTKSSNSNDTVGHGLGITPQLIITKSRNATSDWDIQTTVIDGSLDYLRLNNVGAKIDIGQAVPTDNVFTTASDSGHSAIAYTFATVEGKCKVGNYTGSGVSGNTVDCGFEPQWVMVKKVDSPGDWCIDDNQRNGAYLEADTADAESPSEYNIVFNENGFTVNSVSGRYNGNNGTYLFLAIAKSYNNKATNITTLFDTDTRSGRDLKVKVDLEKSGDEVTRISIPIEKLG